LHADMRIGVSSSVTSSLNWPQMRLYKIGEYTLEVGICNAPP
jgi:hypothetical protein